MLLNRDLRVHDHPALAQAHLLAEHVVRLYVFDDAILAGSFAAPNRLRFLLESLADLRCALRRRGADLVVRRGDPVAETMTLAGQAQAEAVYVSADVSRYAHNRQARLAAVCEQQRLDFATFPGVTVLPPEALAPAGGDHYRVFTPYWRAWQQSDWRRVAPTPRRLRLPGGVDPGALPTADELVTGAPSPRLPAGGETAGRARASAWTRSAVEHYQDRHDDLPGDATSRLSPYLHLGCVSALETARSVAGRPGAETFVRQLCWRDFHHQVTAAFPGIASTDYRPRADRWRDDPGAAAAWREGRTGFPVVDAGMRQLAHEGWLHNRARLIVASFLTKDLFLDWRVGAAHFLHWLVDGDIANNSGNWQWVAGTGNDTRPNRMFNPLRQADRFDPHGDYVRRYVPELADVEGSAVHRPWKLPADRRCRLPYPRPIVDHDHAAHAYRQRRPAGSSRRSPT